MEDEYIRKEERSMLEKLKRERQTKRNPINEMDEMERLQLIIEDVICLSYKRYCINTASLAIIKANFAFLLINAWNLSDNCWYILFNRLVSATRFAKLLRSDYCFGRMTRILHKRICKVLLSSFHSVGRLIILGFSSANLANTCSNHILHSTLVSDSTSQQKARGRKIRKNKKKKKGSGRTSKDGSHSRYKL